MWFYLTDQQGIAHLEETPKWLNASLIYPPNLLPEKDSV